MSIESPLIGSGSQEEVDARVAALIDLGKSRGFLTYEELNEKLPDEVDPSLERALKETPAVFSGKYRRS